MLELVAGSIVAIAALAVVLEPLVARSQPLVPAPSDDEPDLVNPEESDSPKFRALLVLKEIEFDRATGKLSEEDYQALKTKYSAEAVAAMKQEDVTGRAEAAASLDAAEAAVQRFKAGGTAACQVCGPRPESGARFCSTCGRSLTRAGARPRCWQCGAEVPEGAKFCAGCGGQIAA